MLRNGVLMQVGHARRKSTTGRRMSSWRTSWASRNFFAGQDRVDVRCRSPRAATELAVARGRGAQCASGCRHGAWRSARTISGGRLVVSGSEDVAAVSKWSEYLGREQEAAIRINDAHAGVRGWTHRARRYDRRHDWPSVSDRQGRACCLRNRRENYGAAANDPVDRNSTRWTSPSCLAPSLVSAAARDVRLPIPVVVSISAFSRKRSVASVLRTISRSSASLSVQYDLDDLQSGDPHYGCCSSAALFCWLTACAAAFSWSAP